MATGLKKHDPGIRFSGNLVTPDEIDRYEVYQVIFPDTDSDAVGTCVGTSTQSKAIVMKNELVMDYPRNLRVEVRCASGSTKGGTATVTGVDQFGVAVSETFAIEVAADGGTTNGTKVFARVSTATFEFGTSNAGNGSVDLGYATLGTAAMFGLPTKIAGTGDVKLVNWITNGTHVPLTGGTVDVSFIDTTFHAVKAPKDVVGTAVYTVWLRPTFNNEGGATKLSNFTGVYQA